MEPEHDQRGRPNEARHDLTGSSIRHSERREAAAQSRKLSRRDQAFNLILPSEREIPKPELMLAFRCSASVNNCGGISIRD
jgi:hypothetical protein